MGKINTSTIKSFVIESGFRCAKDAIEPLRESIEKYAMSVVEKAKEAAKEAKRKTIMGEDIAKALESENDEDEDEDLDDDSDNEG